MKSGKSVRTCGRDLSKVRSSSCPSVAPKDTRLQTTIKWNYIAQGLETPAD